MDFIKRGCYNNLLNARPLPQPLFTDLDESSPDFSGFAINWGNWDSHLDDMVCRCAQLSKGKGFGNFGIANFGEYRDVLCFPVILISLKMVIYGLFLHYRR